MNLGPTGVTTEGAVRWTPPPGFENPVPEPGDRKGRGCGTLVLFLLAVVVALAVGNWSSIKDGYDRAGDAYDDVTQSIEDLRDEIEGDEVQQEDDLDADGRLELSDGRAALAYQVVDGMSEYTKADDKQQAGGDGYEVAGVSRDFAGEASYLALDGSRLDFAVNAANADELAGDFAGQFGQSIGTGSPPYRMTERDGTYRLSYQGTGSNGRRHLVVWYLKGNQTVRYYCEVDPADVEFWRLCRRAVPTMRVAL